MAKKPTLDEMRLALTKAPKHMAEGGSDEDYRGSHQAPGPHFGAPMHDVSGNGMYPEDFYSPKGAHYYGNINNPIDREAHRQVLSVRGKPDAMVTIHRAIPTHVHEAAMKTQGPIKHMIRHGDWVAIHKGYAKIHGEGPLKGKYKIASMRVPAKHVWTNADSIHEWGYHPEENTVTKAKGGEVKYPSIEEMLQKLREAGRTPILPAPNRWFADPEKHPYQQRIIEKALEQTGQGREGFPSGSYINPQTGEPMDFDIMEDLGVAIDPVTGRPMMSGKKSNLTEIDPKLGSVTKSNLVRKGLFKHEGGDQLLKDLAFLATIEKSGKGHHYGLSTHYASPAELVNTMTGKNPTLRPHSRGDIYGVGDEVGRISIQGKHHPVYEKLMVAPVGSHVQGKKLHKAKGGQVTHAHHLEIEERPL